MPDIRDAVKRITDSMTETAPAETESESTLLETEEVETAQVETEAEPERYKVKVGDEELDLTLEEMKLGYMRNADYERKMHGSRQLREQLEAQTSEFTDTLEKARNLIELEVNDLESEEAKELRSEDPEEYLRRVEAVKAKAEKFKELQSKQQKTLEEQKQERLKKEGELLSEAIPDWLDNEKKVKDTQAIVGLLTESGYSQEEINSLVDHRFFVLARKAALFDEIQKQDLKSKEVKQPPKVSKPGSTQKEPQVSKAYKDAREKSKQTGHVRDAARAIRELMR